MYSDRFHVQLLTLAVTGFTGISVSAQTEPVFEEVVVTGVRQAQQTAIQIERDADTQVDAISAEDIGKLPDVTITDSLQRIGGVQIRRSAGEGASLNVRGMAQVLTELNGESYLGANAITTVQPNYTDLPSQLFAGAEIFKAQTASQHPGGISGVVNLKSYRPFAFEEGLTLSGAAEASTGIDSGELDPSVNGLINWKNDRFGVMVSLSHQTANLANYYAGLNGGGENAGWTGFAGEDWSYDWVTPAATLGEPDLGSRILGDWVDINGNEQAAHDPDNGVIGDSYWAYQGHAAYNRFTERERNGANFALQVAIGDAWELVAEAFLTDMEDYDRVMGLAHSDKWQRWGWFSPQAFTARNALGDGRNLHTVQVYEGNGRRFKTYSSVQAVEADSQNLNLELHYDRGGALTGSARLVHGEAELERLNSYMDIDLADGSQWGVQCQYYPPGVEGQQGECADGQLRTNPEGYRGYPVLTVDYRGGDPHWSGFDNNANLDLQGAPLPGAANQSLNQYIEAIASYSVGALTSENNFLREGTLDVARFDGRYLFEDQTFLDALEFGVRFSSRSVDNFEFDLLSPIGADGSPCGVKWKATDVVLDGGGIEGACTYGDGTNYYAAGVPTPISTLEAVQVDDFGSVTGLPSIWAVDPASMDDVESYHQRLYPGTYREINPGRSYGVDLDELSYFVQANFSTGIMSGNFGVRAVETDLEVVRNEVGDPQPYGAANQDIGDVTTQRDFFDLLPALNLRFDITDNWVIRSSVTKTMAPLDLAQWGGGLAPSYAIDSNEDSDTYQQFIVIGANSDGNPELDPWRANNFDIAAEYYLGSASAMSVAWFYIEVESFIESGSIEMALPDQDGVVRRSVDVTTSVQGEGGNLQGVELSSRLAFSDITDGVLANFGSDINYTWSPSSSGQDGLNGESLPFQDNSEHVFNLIGWYESDRWQARMAYNYRSERVVAFNQTWGVGTLWQQPTAYLDASASFDLTDEISLFINASNITSEKEEYFLEWEDQFAWQSEYEARYTLGVRATF